MEILEQKITISKMRNLQEEIDNSFELAEKRNIKLESEKYSIWKTKIKNKDKEQRKTNRLRKSGVTLKCTNICITGVPEGEACERGTGRNAGRNNGWNISNVIFLKINPRSSKSLTEDKFKEIHIQIQMLKDKDKEKILKVARENWLVTNKVTQD